MEGGAFEAGDLLGLRHRGQLLPDRHGLRMQDGPAGGDQVLLHLGLAAHLRQAVAQLARESQTRRPPSGMSAKGKTPSDRAWIGSSKRSSTQPGSASSTRSTRSGCVMRWNRPSGMPSMASTSRCQGIRLVRPL